MSKPRICFCIIVASDFHRNKLCKTFSGKNCFLLQKLFCFQQKKFVRRRNKFQWNFFFQQKFFLVKFFFGENLILAKFFFSKNIFFGQIFFLGEFFFSPNFFWLNFFFCERGKISLYTFFNPLIISKIQVYRSALFTIFKWRNQDLSKKRRQEESFWGKEFMDET